MNVIEVPKSELDRLYKLAPVAEDKLRRRLEDLAKYAVYAGMTPEAAKYLPTLTPMTKEDIEVATKKGKATQAKHQAAGEADEAKSGKAPRKLAGAALAAKLRKDANRREAERATAEAAKTVAHEVSEDLKAAEAAGAPDVRVDVGKSKKSMSKVAKKDAEQVIKETRDVQIRGGRFDAAALKNSDGAYKSASAMFKGLILEDSKKAKGKRRTDEQIFAEVRAKFDLSDDKLGYVKWNRGWLVRTGVLTKEQVANG